MKATVITIGDEILIGKTIDTNSAWIGQQLNLLGIQIDEIITISDDRKHILRALHTATMHSDIIILTGGLGPTKDDITKATIAEFFKVDMVLNDEIFERIKMYFSKRGAKYVEMNKQLAYLPSNAESLGNNKGTAVGMWFFDKGKAYISLPGVPHEMKEILREKGFDKISDAFDLPFIIHRHIMTAGVGETVLSDILDEFEDNLPQYVKLAYLPNLGSVKLRLSAFGEDEVELQKEVDELTDKASELIGDYVYGYDEESLEAAIGRLLLEKKANIATAESCTGGNIAHRITMVPGSSKYFEGSIVSYSNEVKMKSLQVSKVTLEQHGAVSEEVVKEMVSGVRKALNVDYAIAISGIAGPGGGSSEKPVGTVWIAVGNEAEIVTRKYVLTPSREENIEISTTLALNNLRRFLTGQLEKH